MSAAPSSVPTGYDFKAWLFPVVPKDKESALTKIFTDPFGFQKVIKLISNIALVSFGKAAFPAMEFRINSTEAGIDSFGIFGDIKNFLNGKFKDDYNKSQWYSLAARVSMLAADIGCTVLWIAELTVTELSLVAQSIGSIKIFGATPLKFVTKLPSLGNLALGACWIGFIFMTVDSLGKIQSQNPSLTFWQCITESKSSAAWTNLAYASSEVFLKTLVLVSCASTTLLGGAGIAAAVLGLRAMVYTESKAKAS